MSGGFSKATGVLPDKILLVILFQIGGAPVTPEVSEGCMGVLSLFPTQTPTTYSGVNPKVQLSRLLSVVPVLTAVLWPGIFSKDAGPNAGVRARLSARMSLIKKAIAGEITFCPWSLVLSSMVFPLVSVIFNTPLVWYFLPF